MIALDNLAMRDARGSVVAHDRRTLPVASFTTDSRSLPAVDAVAPATALELREYYRGQYNDDALRSATDFVCKQGDR